MPLSYDKEERIRRWPLWFARLANHIVGWTTETCAAGCGYPVTRRFRHPIETIDGCEVVMLLCSTHSDCEWDVMSKFRDGTGATYAEIRPDIIKMIALHPESHIVPISIEF